MYISFFLIGRKVYPLHIVFMNTDSKIRLVCTAQNKRLIWFVELKISELIKVY